MSRRNHNIEEDVRRVMIRELLQKKNASSIQVLLKETIIPLMTIVFTGVMVKENGSG
jgi:hypothetical protein